MPKATGAFHGLSYVAESAFGTTPGPSPAPSMLRLRHIATTLDHRRGELVPGEIREDGQIDVIEPGNHLPGGNIEAEFAYGAYDDFLAAVMRGSWSANVLKVGTLSPSFSIERRFTDITDYIVFKGSVVDTCELSVEQSEEGSFARATFDIIARSVTLGGSSLGTPADVATDSPFVSFRGTVQEGGGSIATVTAVRFNIANNYSRRFIVGDDRSVEPARGRIEVTGEITAFLENLDLYTKFVQADESSLSVELEDAAGNTLTISAPRIKYSGGSIPKQGDDDILLTMPFRAAYDDGDASTLVLTRTPAA